MRLQRIFELKKKRALCASTNGVKNFSPPAISKVFSGACSTSHSLQTLELAKAGPRTLGEFGGGGGGSMVMLQCLH